MGSPADDGSLLGHELSLWVVLFHDALARRLGLNPTEHKILDAITHHPGITPSELSDSTELSQPAITKVVHRLVALDYVRRDTDAADGRRLRLSVTPAYAATTAALYQPLVAPMLRLAEQFDDKERAAIQRWLTATIGILRDATAAVGADPTPP